MYGLYTLFGIVHSIHSIENHHRFGVEVERLPRVIGVLSSVGTDLSR